VKGTAIRCVFVSTNSISQGEQRASCGRSFRPQPMKIHFAHRTFPWRAKRAATPRPRCHHRLRGRRCAAKFITDYDTDLEHPTRTQVSNINPYLVRARYGARQAQRSLCPVPAIVFGSMPNDGGHLLLSSEEKTELLRVEPGAAKFLRPFRRAEKFINGAERWCLWLAEATASELRSLPTCFGGFKESSSTACRARAATTRQLAAQPSLFGENRQPTTHYLLIPGCFL